MMTKKLNPEAYPAAPLQVEKLGRRSWRLLRDWIYKTRSGLTITVPAGFACDLASIPRIFWTAVGAPADYAEAATCHDYIYRLRDRAFAAIPGLAEYLEITGPLTSRKAHGILRQWADSMYYHALADMGVGRANRRAQYRFVRVFGWFVWRFRRG